MKDAPVFVPPPTWTGFYLGGHVGGAWGELKNNYVYDPAWNWAADSWKTTNDGVFGGGTLGYNWQTGAFVFGFESDFGAIGFSNTSKWAGGNGYGYYGDYWHKQDTSFYADVTGRLGYAAGPALFYAKGGWAYLDNSATFGFGELSNSWQERFGSTAGRSAAVSNICGALPGASKPSICISTSARRASTSTMRLTSRIMIAGTTS